MSEGSSSDEEASTLFPPQRLVDGDEDTHSQYSGELLPMTISDDHTVKEHLRQRKLAALRKPAPHDSAPRGSAPWSPPRDSAPRDSAPYSYLDTKELSSFARGLGTAALAGLYEKNKSRQERGYVPLIQEVPQGPSQLQLGQARIVLSKAQESSNRENSPVHSNSYHSMKVMERARPQKGRRVTDDSPIRESVIEDMNREELIAYIQLLRNQAETTGNGTKNAESGYWRFRHLVLYRVNEQVETDEKPKSTKSRLSRLYFDAPELMSGEHSDRRFKFSGQVKNLELYLERNKDVCAIVYHTYIESDSQSKSGENRSQSLNPNPMVVEISIRPLERQFQDAVVYALKSTNACSEVLQHFRSTGELRQPYIFYRHYSSIFERIANTCDQPTASRLRLLMDHIVLTEGQEFEAADDMISSAKISPRLLKYLLKPNETIVYRSNDEYAGWMTRDWARKEYSTRMSRSEAIGLVKGVHHQIPTHTNLWNRVSGDDVLVHIYSVAAWQWQFDGKFSRREDNLKWYIQQEISDFEDEQREVKPSSERTLPIAITETRVIPLRFCPPETLEKLRKRGQTFWRCRKSKLVSYQKKDDDVSPVDDRYMVDYDIYYELHGRDTAMSKHRSLTFLGTEVMKQDTHPTEDFELLLPTTIKGFHLQRKKWHDLAIDRIAEVTWNKEAFSKIVMDHKSKEIIRALLSKQLASEHGTDLIAGKGNGLILLLHGGPGTGKTLTAESVAEIAEKPLYRVTCGDVGTKAEAVEKYLESVFHLGKTWGCVVLLDEADVFLQQRNLKDLERNALVSVFLRVLEYYEGILILTSNRVGTFDEAFRSRIQLALHYPPLTKVQRGRVWENFIDRLEMFKDGTVDISDLKYHLDELSEEKMNGREIRNVITTARQYVEYKNSVLNYAQLRDVINVSSRFDTYLNQVRGGLTDEEIARDVGIR